MWREFIRIGEAVLRRERGEVNRTPHRESSYLCSPETLGERETCETGISECDRAARSAGGTHGKPQATEEQRIPRKPPAPLQDASDQRPQRQSASPIFDHVEGTMELFLEGGESVKIILDSTLRKEDDEGMKGIILQSRVTKQQQVMIRKAARAAGQTVSFYVRECVMQQVERQKNPPSENMKESIVYGINLLLRTMSEEEESA